MAADLAGDLNPGAHTADPTDPVEAGTVPAGRRGDVLTLFAVLWAFANLFHIWGPSARATGILSDFTAVGASHVLIGVAAVAVLVSPRSVGRLGVLAVLGLPAAWLEAPVMGSHWILVVLVDLAILISIAVAAPWRTGMRIDRERVEEVFVPTARWVLLGFYAFAAFAKLNSAFFSPAVSCGTFYTDELLGSLHLHVHTMRDVWWATLVPAGVAAIELSVPVLLLNRRTRHIGVVVGLVFHGIIALDQAHLFSDFSSVLDALFTLFLPAAFATWVISLVRSLDRSTRDAVHAAVVVGASALLALQWYGQGSALERLFRDGRAWAWVVLDVTLIALAVRFLLRYRPRPDRRMLAPWSNGVPRVLLVVPALTLLCGLAPYLELRTAYAFNMYANLRTAGGSSNHFVVRATLPLTDFQKDLVRIQATDDPNLQLYVDSRFDIPFLQLRDYLSHHPDAALTYLRGGVVHHVDHASDDPALVEPVPSWESKLFAFRSLDQTSPARCQPTFYAAL